MEKRSHLTHFISNCVISDLDCCLLPDGLLNDIRSSVFCESVEVFTLFLRNAGGGGRNIGTEAEIKYIQ